LFSKGKVFISFFSCHYSCKDKNTDNHIVFLFVNIYTVMCFTIGLSRNLCNFKYVDIFLLLLMHCVIYPYNRFPAFLQTSAFVVMSCHHQHHHWLDSPWWALAFLRICAHSSPSGFNFFRFRDNNF
jgi:hypothetical protein